VDWVETTGRTVDEATRRALQSLGVSAADAEVVVVTEGRRGVLGIGRLDARVRARVRPTRPRAKVDGRRRHRNRRREEQGAAGGPQEENLDERISYGGPDARIPDGSSGSGSGVVGIAVAGSIEGDREADRTGVALDVSDQEAEPGPAEHRTSGTPARRRRRRSRRSKVARAAADHRVEQVSEVATVDGVDESEEAEQMELEVPIEEQAEAARDFVAGVVERMALSATVETEILGEDAAEIRVVGDQIGILVGRGGSTVEALQDLTRTVVQRQTRARHGRLVVDVGDYRRLRRAALERFVREVANEVLATGIPQELDEMPPPDRKVVHDTVNLIPGVTTRSVGEEPHRRVVVVREEAAEAQPTS
jgi:spoIIIJ-associated protein